MPLTEALSLRPNPLWNTAMAQGVEAGDAAQRLQLAKQAQADNLLHGYAELAANVWNQAENRKVEQQKVAETLALRKAQNDLLNEYRQGSLAQRVEAAENLNNYRNSRLDDFQKTIELNERKATDLENYRNSRLDQLSEQLGINRDKLQNAMDRFERMLTDRKEARTETGGQQNVRFRLSDLSRQIRAYQAVIGNPDVDDAAKAVSKQNLDEAMAEKAQLEGQLSLPGAPAAPGVAPAVDNADPLGLGLPK